MIHFTLRGGLANMFFQVAAVNAIALSKGTKASFHNLNNQLNYLDRETDFNPHLKHSSEYMKLGVFQSMITEKAPEGLQVHKYPFHYENKNVTDNCILDGFFQSEKYFKEYSDEIRELFKPTEEMITEIQVKYGHLFKERTTSIHVRRGDYVRHPNHHPIQPLEYYQRAIELTKNKTDKYVIFSDDIQWCKETFKGDMFIFIEDEKDYIEIYLMSMCNYNIIANSSFSWWGAWLNNNNDKVVIGPRMWFGSAYRTWNTNDVIPENWIKI